MSMKWNQNGNWLLTASRDHLCKIFDIRAMKEMQTFRGHKKEATTIAWHPIYESMFASGGSDGSIMFWLVGTDKDIGAMEQAHDGMVWSMAWHPLGHILCSGSNDHSSKFWTRNRPGDRLRDKYNLNLPEEEEDYESQVPGFTSSAIIPGMETVYTNSDITLPATSGSDNTNFKFEAKSNPIPGLSSPPASSKIGVPGLGSPTSRKPPGSIPGLGEPPGKPIEKKPYFRGSNLRPDAPTFRPQQPQSQFNSKATQEIPGLDSAPKEIPGPGPGPRVPFPHNPGPRPGMIRPPRLPQEAHTVEKKPLLPDPTHIPGFPPFSQGNMNPPGPGKGERPPEQRNALLPDPPGLPNKFTDGNLPGKDRPQEARDFHMGQGPPGPPGQHQGPNMDQRAQRANEGFENRDPRQHRPGQEPWMRGDNDREGPVPPDFDRSRRGLLEIPPEYAGRPPPDFRPPFSQAGPGPDNRPPPNQLGPGPTFRPPHPDFQPGHPDQKEPEHRRHQDMNAQVFRHGGPGRGRGREGPWEDRDHDEPERDHPPHPFQNQPRGFRNQGPGSSPGPPEDPRMAGRHPDRVPHGDRRSSFEEPGLLGPVPGVPVGGPGGGPAMGGMGPRSGPKPLMSLDIVPPPVDQSQTRHILDDQTEERQAGRRSRERDRPEGDRGPNSDWERANRDRPGSGPPRPGPGPWTESDDPRNERREQPGDPRMRRGADGPWGRPDDLRSRPEDPRSRPDDPRNRPDDPRGRPDDPHNRPDDPRGRPEGIRGRPDDPRGRPDDARSRPDDPRGRPDVQRTRPDDPRSRPDDPRSRPEDPRGRPNDPRGRPEDSRGRQDDPRGRPDDHRGRPDDPRVRTADPRVRQDEMRSRLEDMHGRSEDPRNRGDVQRIRMEEQRGHPSSNWPHHNDKHPAMMDELRRHPDDPRIRAMDEQRSKPEDPRGRKRPLDEAQFQESDKRGTDFQSKVPRSEGESWKGPPGSHQQALPKEEWFSSWGEEKGKFGFNVGSNERPEQRGLHEEAGRGQGSRGRGRGRGRS